MTEAQNDAARIEKAVSEMMRGARDEKVRLETLTREQAQQIADIHQRLTEQHDRNEHLIRDILHRHAEETTKLAEDRDAYLRRATQLETDLRSLGAIINDALTTKPIFGLPSGLSDLRQNVATDRRPQVLDRSPDAEEQAILDPLRPFAVRNRLGAREDD